jgi:predicted GIY-YIG superfamily endonuclease
VRDLQAKSQLQWRRRESNPRTVSPVTEQVADVGTPSFAGDSREQWLYRLYAADGALLYIGVTQCGEERFADHRKSKSWWPEVASTTRQVYATREEVLVAERHAIYREKPRYNIVHASTGRRLYGAEPFPASEPLTAEAARRRTAERVRRALHGDQPPRAAASNVVYLSDFRRSAA